MLSTGTSSASKGGFGGERADTASSSDHPRLWGNSHSLRESILGTLTRWQVEDRRETGKLGELVDDPPARDRQDDLEDVGGTPCCLPCVNRAGQAYEMPFGLDNKQRQIAGLRHSCSLWLTYMWPG